MIGMGMEEMATAGGRRPREGATPGRGWAMVSAYSAAGEGQGGRSTSVTRPIGASPSPGSTGRPDGLSGGGSGDGWAAASGRGRGFEVGTTGGGVGREQVGPEQAGARSGAGESSGLAH